MTQKRWNIIGILSLLLAAAGAYFWATAQFDGVLNYRSLLSQTPPTAGEPFAWAQDNPLTERVVFILVDGLRNDTAHDANIMPTLNELRDKGAWATSHSREPSYSAPGYSTLATGAWPHLNDGPAFNLDYEDIPVWTQDNIFSAVHRAGLQTAASGYHWFEKLIPQGVVNTSFYTADYDAAADEAVMQAALPWIESGAYQFLFIHLDQVDTAGHDFGATSQEWDAAAAQVDSHIREIVSRLDLGQDTVLITSDHGHINTGGHGGGEDVVLTEPFVLVGAGVQPGEYPDIEMIDIAPTLSVLLGANIPATAQGHVLTEMLTLSDKQKDAVASALDTQKRQLHTAYVEVIGEELPIREDMGVVDGTNFAIDAMLLTQVDKFRRLRFNLPIFILVVPAYILFRNRKSIKRELLAALAYLILFNLAYAFIARRTYTFSSVESQNNLIIFNGIATLILFSITWLVHLVKSGVHQKGALKAAQSTLILTGLTVYLWLLPALWNYGVNDFVSGWFLPDFSTLFIGILALIQIIFVALVGILLTGIATLIAKQPA